MFHFILLIMYINIVQFRMNVKYVVDEIMDIYKLDFTITHDQLYIDIYVFSIFQKLFLTVRHRIFPFIKDRIRP